MRNEVKKIIEDLKVNNVMTILQEVGYINVDYIDDDLGDFLEALRTYTNEDYRIVEKIGMYVVKKLEDGEIGRY